METPIERFYSRIIEDSNGCWNWNGYLRQGYGSLKINGKRVYAHRFAYEHFNGPLLYWHHVHHECGNRKCCNPAHLEQLTCEEHGKQHIT